MDALTIAAASGLRSRIESLELLANNLANAGTSGYKSDREFYGVFTGEAQDAMGDGSSSTLPVVERQWTDFSQGTIQPTGNQLDVALAGHGFLTVNGPSGTLYTRSGNIHISNKGELINGEGFQFRTKAGGPIRVSNGKPIEIATDGTVRQDGQALGQLELVDFKSTESLRKVSGSCFENSNPKNPVVAAPDAEVQQGKLEGSNVVVPEAAMRLVGVMRQFEMLQKAVSMGVDMNRKAIEEVARVGG
jgi:flagellar basal-body rod protein FlgF